MRQKIATITTFLILFICLMLYSQKTEAVIIFEDDFDGYTEDYSLNDCSISCPLGGKYSSAKGCYGSPTTPGAISTLYDRNPGTNKRAFFVPIFSSWQDEGNCGTSSVGSEIGLGSIWNTRSQIIFVRWYQQDTWVGWGNFAKLFRISNGNLGTLGTQRVVPEWKPNFGHVQMNLSINDGSDYISHFWTNYNLDEDYIPGSWVCYELKIDALNQVAEFWVNGNSMGEIDISAAMPSDIYFNSHQTSGNYSYTAGQTGNHILFDDIVISDSYVGPLGQPSDTTAPGSPVSLTVR